MRLEQLGQRIQWLFLRPGIHIDPPIQRSPRSVRLMRLRASHDEHVTMTVPVRRGPVENSASRPSLGVPARMVSRWR